MSNAATPALSRQYSLCGDPADTQRASRSRCCAKPDGRGGSAWIHGQRAASATAWRIRGPRNHFRLDESARRLILIAGGIGITPMSAMARRARALGLDYALHYSGRRRGVDGLRRRAGRTARRAAPSACRRRGRAQRSRRACWPRPEPGTQIYACGPVRMLAGARGLLRPLARGRAARGAFRIHPRRARSVEGAGLRGRAEGFGHRRAGAGRPDAARMPCVRANVDVQSDCEEGLCGSCEVRRAGRRGRPPRRGAHPRGARGSPEDDDLLLRACGACAWCSNCEGCNAG